MTEETEQSTIHAAIYARVSTDDQVQGTSLESQIEACHAYARSNGLVVWQSHVFKDGGVSGTLLERPALDAMREVVRTGAIQVIIVYALDRLSRVLWHQCMLVEGWQKDGVQIHTVREKIEETPEGQLLRHVMGAFAQLEREKIRDRMMRGKAALLAKGISNSHTAPYGYRWTYVPHASMLEVDEAEAEVVRQIFRWCLEGQTLRWITMELTRERIPTRRAHLFPTRRKTAPWCWNRSTIHRMVRYEGYVGRIYVGKETMVGKTYVKQPREHWTELSIPPIIDQETFDAVGERLIENQRKASRNSKHVYLLSSATLRCGLCGGGMGGCTKINEPRTRAGVLSERGVRSGKGVWTSTYYLCNTHVSRMDGSHCRVYVPGSVIEPRVWAFVEHLFAHPKTIDAAITLAQQGGTEQ
jgi:site-specific DNA recombinase